MKNHNEKNNSKEDDCKDSESFRKSETFQLFIKAREYNMMYPPRKIKEEIENLEKDFKSTIMLLQGFKKLGEEHNKGLIELPEKLVQGLNELTSSQQKISFEKNAFLDLINPKPNDKKTHEENDDYVDIDDSYNDND